MTEQDDAPNGDSADPNLRVVVTLIAAIVDGEGPLIVRELQALHPADAADVLEQLSPEQFAQVLSLAPEAFSSDLIAELEDEPRAATLEVLPTDAVAEVVAELDSDDATDVVDTLPPERREEVLAELPAQERRAVEEGLSHEDDTAGRLMQREFVAAPEFWTLGAAVDHMRATPAGELPDMFFEIYLVDLTFRPVGSILLSDIVKHPRETPMVDIARDLHLLVRPEMDQEDVAYAFAKYHLAQAPVVDEAGRLTGMITIDDMVEVIHDENEEDMLALAGVREGGSAMTALAQMQARSPWLLINLVTAIAASAVVSLFGASIKEIVALAILMPIVAALGGNVGTQALTVAVRALAARDLTPANAQRMIAREAATALLNGLLFAVLVALVAGFWFRDVWLAGVMAAALLINFLAAGLAGILAPLTLKRLGADPAVASSVFVSTVTDVVGFFVFLGLATIVLL